MQKREYLPRVSDVLGFALIFASLLCFLVTWISSDFDMSTGSIFLKLILELPIFLLPTLGVFFVYRRLGMPIPVLPRSLGYSESAMLTVSTFGAIVLMQVLYGSVFPSVVAKARIEETESVFGFLLLFLSTVVIPAVLQELFFRGAILRSLTAYRVLLAILISSVADALMRFSLEAFPIVFFCGFLIGSLYCATGSLSAAISVHLTANAAWFLGETVRVYMPLHYGLFVQVLVTASVLLLAFGLPFLKKTVQAILADEHDDAVWPTSQFWGAPIIVFLVLAIAVQLFVGTI
jgi:membrane protease YdiL (CAAX protease family)